MARAPGAGHQSRPISSTIETQVVLSEKTYYDTDVSGTRRVPPGMESWLSLVHQRLVLYVLARNARRTGDRANPWS